MAAFLLGINMISIRKKSIIYIDGFNLYYGALKNTKWKWLNLEKLFSMLRQDDEILKIKYFTALINQPSSTKQQIYLKALATLPKVDIILGKFKMKTVKCLFNKCTYNGNRLFQMPEEKRTDVNIAVHILNDIFIEDTERIVLISGDSDLVPVLKMVKNLKPEIELIVYIPATTEIRAYAVELRGAADKHKTLPNNLFKISQFPQKVQNSFGEWIEKPINW